jgi:hypothetical protein
MTKTQIEMRAIEIIDRAIAKHHVEDSHAELKSQWPEVSPVSKARETARQIAGQANAARGEPILWLIGVDERAGKVFGADPLELSNWFAAIKAQFDGVAPNLTDVNVPYDKGQTVVALHFETDRSPFVVKNPVHGATGGGPVELEVPWREGRSTRSASRLDLFRLLMPVQRLPVLEVLGCELSLFLNQTSPSPPIGHIWSLQVNYFGTPPTNCQVVIPSHNCELDINFEGQTFPSLQDQFIGFGTQVPPSASLIQASDAHVILNGPGRFHMTMTRHTMFARFQSWEVKAKVEITFRPVNSDRSIKQEMLLRPRPLQNDPRVACWIMEQIRR